MCKGSIQMGPQVLYGEGYFCPLSFSESQESKGQAKNKTKNFSQEQVDSLVVVLHASIAVGNLRHFSLSPLLLYAACFLVQNGHLIPECSDTYLLQVDA